MTEIVQSIPARLKNVAVNGHVAGASDIMDDSLNKTQNVINAEVAEAIGTGGSVDSRIAATKAGIIGNATSACDTLGKAEALISAEVSARQSAISNVIGDAATDYNTLGKLEDKIQAEASRAEEAESTLGGKIATEKTRAEAAEQANSTAVTNEVSRAQNAEAALGNRITPLEEAVGTGGTIDQRIENATKNAAYIDASEQGSENVNW